MGEPGGIKSVGRHDENVGQRNACTLAKKAAYVGSRVRLEYRRRRNEVQVARRFWDRGNMASVAALKMLEKPRVGGLSGKPRAPRFDASPARR